MNRPESEPHYLGSAGARYAQFHQSDPTSDGYRLNAALFEPYLQPNDSLLDFGCGNGGMLRVLRGLVREAQGLEVNPTAAAIARQSGCTVYSSIEELPGEPRFDVIVSNHALEHPRDVCSTLERLRRNLKPRGRFVAVGERRRRGFQESPEPAS